MQAAFEDVEFCVRARKAGVVVTYDPDAVVRHHYDHTWPGLFRCVGLPGFRLASRQIRAREQKQGCRATLNPKS